MKNNTRHTTRPPVISEVSPEQNGQKLEIVRLSKDEMNLVEYPFAALWRSENREVVINHEWEAQHPDTGKSLKAVWRVQGDPELGLPTANDEKVYLVLLELTREAKLEQKVFFTSHEIIKRLGWPVNMQSYRMLFQAFQRLKAVTITAHNTFWNPRARTFRNVVFSIIDNVDITPEKRGRKKTGHHELPMSYFKWNDIIYESFQSGYIRSIDLDFVLSLKGDITPRLYRYLDKKKYDGRRTFEIELSVLCTRHLGMKPSPYPSKLKERIKPAHDELIKRGFIKEVSYHPMSSRKGEKVCYSFTGKPLPLSEALAEKSIVEAEKFPRGNFQSEPPQSEPTSEPTPDQLLLLPSEDVRPGLRPDLPSMTDLPEETDPPEEKSQRRGEPSSSGAPSESSPDSSLNQRDAAAANLMHAPDPMQELSAAGVSPVVARELIESFPVEQILMQLGCLDDRAPRDRAATFVKSLREQWEPPTKYLERQEAAERAEKAKRDQETAGARKAAHEFKEREEQAATEREAAQLDKVWESLDARTRERIEKEAIDRLGILGQTGRAQAALAAMRRSLLRELLGQLHNDAE